MKEFIVSIMIFTSGEPILNESTLYYSSQEECELEQNEMMNRLEKRFDIDAEFSFICIEN